MILLFIVVESIQWLVNAQLPNPFTVVFSDRGKDIAVRRLSVSL